MEVSWESECAQLDEALEDAHGAPVGGGDTERTTQGTPSPEGAHATRTTALTGARHHFSAESSGSRPTLAAEYLKRLRDEPISVGERMARVRAHRRPTMCV